jgi:hypothetical protein
MSEGDAESWESIFDTPSGGLLLPLPRPREFAKALRAPKARRLAPGRPFDYAVRESGADAVFNRTDAKHRSCVGNATIYKRRRRNWPSARA